MELEDNGKTDKLKVTYIKYDWIATTSEKCINLLKKAFLAIENDNEEIYIGRAYHDGYIIPCKVIPSQMYASINHHGKEIKVKTFQLFCPNDNCKIKWKVVRNGEKPEGVIPVGISNSGETLYVGKPTSNIHKTIGKVKFSNARCYIYHDGKERKEIDFEVLVLSS